MATVSEISARKDAVHVAYMLFIQGVPDVFVSDHINMELLGGGSGSWINASETALSHETAGQRTVRRGLIIPNSLMIGEMDIRDGLQDTDASFEIVDFDNRLASLFSIADWDEMDRLQAFIRAGTSDISSSQVGQPFPANGNTTISIADRYVGLEKFGPDDGGNCSRQQFPPFPFQMAGETHTYFNVSGGSVPNEVRPPPIPVSDNPVVHEGRKVALYKLYRDPTSTSSTVTDLWDTWENHYNSNYSLLWWGTLKDRGEITGSTKQYKRWKIQCRGPDSLLQRPLNPYAPRRFFYLQSDGTRLLDEQTFVNVQFRIHDYDDVQTSADLKGAWFYDIAGSKLESDDLFKSSIIARINTVISNVAAGANANIHTSGSTANSTDRNDAQIDYGFVNGGRQFRCAADTNVTGGNNRTLNCTVTLHKKVWMSIGWDPDIIATEPVRGLIAYQVPEGKTVDNQRCPGPGYWSITFSNFANDPPPPSTVIGPNGNPTLPSYASDGNDIDGRPTRDWTDNGGAPVFHPPNGGAPGAVLDGSVQILQEEGNQTILVEAENGAVFEDNTAAGFFSVPSPSGADSTGHIAIRGKVINLPRGAYIENGRAYDQYGDEIELEDEENIQLAKIVWNESISYGIPSEDPDFSINYEMWLEKFLSPRRYGLPFDQIKRDWKFSPGRDFGLECQPVLIYTTGIIEGMRTWELLLSMMQSTGGATGWSSAIDAPGAAFTVGPNNPSGLSVAARTSFSGDVHPYSMGLAIPNQLVAAASEVRDEMVFPRSDIDDPINFEYVAVNPGVNSKDIIEGLLKHRGCSMSLVGGQYNVTRIDYFRPQDIEVTITEDDLFGDSADPTSVILSQQVRVSAPVDQVKIMYGYDFMEDKFEKEILEKPADPGSPFRRGGITEEVRLIGKHRRREGGDDVIRKIQNYWRRNRADFLSRRHFPITFKLNRVAARNVWPGTKMRISNPWPLAPGDTTYAGLTSRMGIVLSTKWTDRMEALECTMMVFDKAQDAFSFFAPIGKITNISGTTITLDQTDTESYYSPGTAFTEPSFSEAGGNPLVDILAYDRTGWTEVTTATVTGSTSTTLTVSSSLDSAVQEYSNADLFVVISGETQQQSSGAQWARDLFIELALEDGTFNTNEGAKRTIS